MTTTNDRGPLQSYEVTWRSGHIETIRAHQVIMPSRFSFLPGEKQDNRVMFHGEIEGRWMLVLAADADEILTIRNVTVTEASSDV